MPGGRAADRVVVNPRRVVVDSIWSSMLGAEVRMSAGAYRGRFVTAGEGPPLVLLHGQGGHLENFRHNVARLAQAHRVIAPDAPWHGLGPQPGFDPELIPVFVDQLRTLLQALDVGPVAVLGQSMGAWTAMRLALDHPSSVSSLVLVNPQGVCLPAGDGVAATEPAPGEQLRERQMAVLREPTEDSVRSRLQGLFGDPGKLDEEAVAVRLQLYRQPAVNASLQRVLASYMGGPGTPVRRYQVDEAQLGSIRCPTLLLWGERNMVPPVVGEQMAAAIPGATLQIAAGAGHWLHYEVPEWHDGRVLDFLARGQAVTA